MASLRMRELFLSTVTVCTALIIVCPIYSPTKISGENSYGGCYQCTDTYTTPCGNRGGGQCADYAYRCDQIGINRCTDFPGGPNSCVVDPDCGNLVNQSCD